MRRGTAFVVASPELFRFRTRGGANFSALPAALRPVSTAPASSAVSEEPTQQADGQTKEKIREYLKDIADMGTGSMPPFDDIARIDKIWVISALWMKVSDRISDTVSLADIEKEARRTINPAITLPADGDYRHFNGTPGAWPKWVPSEKSFTIAPADYGSIVWDYPLTSATRSGSLYKVVCAEIYYKPESEQLFSTSESGVLFCNGRQVGTEKDSADENTSPVFHYTTDPATLPQIGFVLRDNGSGGFFVVSKTRAQSGAKPPEKTSSSGKQSEGANSITEEQAQKIAVKYVKATFRPTAPILAMGTGTETYNGETCYGFELREDNADHAAMLGIYLVGSRSRSLYEMDASTGGYQKVSP